MTQSGEYPIPRSYNIRHYVLSNLDLDHTLWSQFNRRTFLDCHLLFLRLGNFFGTRCTELKTDLTRFLNSLYQSLGGSVTTHVCPGWAPPYNWVLWAGPALTLSRRTAASLPAAHYRWDTVLRTHSEFLDSLWNSNSMAFTDCLLRKWPLMGRN